MIRHDPGSSRFVPDSPTSGRPQRRAHSLSGWSLGQARRVPVVGRVGHHVAACAAIAGRPVRVGLGAVRGRPFACGPQGRRGLMAHVPGDYS